MGSIPPVGYNWQFLLMAPFITQFLFLVPLRLLLITECLHLHLNPVVLKQGQEERYTQRLEYLPTDNNNELRHKRHPDDRDQWAKGRGREGKNWDRILLQIAFLLLSKLYFYSTFLLPLHHLSASCPSFQSLVYVEQTLHLIHFPFISHPPQKVTIREGERGRRMNIFCHPLERI